MAKIGYHDHSEIRRHSPSDRAVTRVLTSGRHAPHYRILAKFGGSGNWTVEHTGNSLEYVVNKWQRLTGDNVTAEEIWREIGVQNANR